MARMLKVLTALLLLQALPLQAASVTRDGKLWLQPADFQDLTRAQIDAACPAQADHRCTGTLAGVDVNGFTFASIEEVSELLGTYGVPAPDHCGGSSARVPDSPWAPEVFTDFVPTYESSGSRFLEGNINDADICESLDDPNCDPGGGGIGFTGIQSEVTLGDGHCIGEGDISVGVWLYRDATPSIPTLTQWSLLLLAILMLGWGGYRFRQSAGPES